MQVSLPLQVTEPEPVKFELTPLLANTAVGVFTAIDSKSTDDLPNEDLKNLLAYKTEYDDKLALVAAQLDSTPNDDDERVSIPVSLPVVKSLLRMHRHLHPSAPMTLHGLLKGARVYIPPPRTVTYPPELAKKLRRLKAKVEREEYNRMVADLPHNRNKIEAASNISSVMKDMSVALNVIAVAATGFAFFYYIGTMLTPGNYATAMGFGSIGLVAGLLLETFLLMLREKQESIVIEQRARKERQAFE
jgi:hypothetical protein